MRLIADKREPSVRSLISDLSISFDQLAEVTSIPGNRFEQLADGGVRPNLGELNRICLGMIDLHDSVVPQSVGRARANFLGEQADWLLNELWQGAGYGLEFVTALGRLGRKIHEAQILNDTPYLKVGWNEAMPYIGGNGRRPGQEAAEFTESIGRLAGFECEWIWCENVCEALQQGAVDIIAPFIDIEPRLMMSGLSFSQPIAEKTSNTNSLGLAFAVLGEEPIFLKVLNEALKLEFSWRST